MSKSASCCDDFNFGKRTFRSVVHGVTFQLPLVWTSSVPEGFPEVPAVMLTGGVCAFHPGVVFMVLPDPFWQEVTLLDSDFLIA